MRFEEIRLNLIIMKHRFKPVWFLEPMTVISGNGRFDRKRVKLNLRASHQVRHHQNLVVKTKEKSCEVQVIGEK